MIEKEPDIHRSGAEIVINAIAVSRGVGVGAAICLFGRERQFFRSDIEEPHIETEVERFRDGCRIAADQLREIVGSGDTRSNTVSGIFDVHLLILEHSSLTAEVESLIRLQRINAEWALQQVADGHIEQQLAVVEPGLRERAADVQDVSERILNALDGSSDDLSTLPADSVLVASSIRPSTMIQFGQHKPKAIITEHGGWTSHAFIMAREMRIPSVTSVGGAFRLIEDGMLVAVDGFSGRVFLNPGADTMKKLSAVHASPAHPNQDQASALGALRTLDGFEITLRINADTIDAYHMNPEIESTGIGLLRSEYLFSGPIAGFPSEAAQTEAYSSIAGLCGDRGVRIRTFDVNADQKAFSAESRERNPALGMRAIRVSLSNEPVFRAQIRSIIRATAYGKVSIVLPMISGVDEILRSRSIITEEFEQLNARVPGLSLPAVGPMIEVPSAVITIGDIAEHSDFLCLGTNDLVQYVLAVDRDNELLAGHYQTLHPAVLRAISMVTRSADLAHIAVVTCGEMAGSPFYVPLLVGLGLREFSMNPNSIPAVRTIIRGISFDEANQLARRVLELPTAAEIEILLKQYYREMWPHLFAPHLLSDDPR